MSVALSAQEIDSPRACEHMLLPGSDPFIFEEVVCAGDHGQYRIEHVDDELLLVFGGRYPGAAGRSVHLHHQETDWSDQALVDRFGGRGVVRMVPGNFPQLLAEYWPTSRFRLRQNGYLACLLECAAYNAHSIVSVWRGETGYILHQDPFPARLRHDPNAYFAVPS